MTRYLLMLVLLVTAVVVPSRFAGSAQPPAEAGDGAIPDAVHAAADQGRYWRASRLMAEYLRTVSDTAAPTILMTARLSAGWDDWETVARLLEGREWLDDVDRGAGWELLGRGLMAVGRPAEAAVAFERYQSRNGDSDLEKGTTELRRGLALGAAGEVDPALEAFRRARRYLPWFADWSSLLAAEVAAAGGDTAAVRTLLTEAGELARGPDWRLRLAAAREAGDSLAAREVALAAAQSGASAATRAAAWTELGTLRMRAGDTARAREAFTRAMQSPGTIHAVDAARALGDLDPSADEWRAIADIYARHGNAARAVEGYARYLDAGAGTASERLEARLRLGRARYNAGQYAAAERGLLELADAEVPAAIGAEALYYAGRSQYRQGRSDAGQRTLARLPERFPGQPTVTEGLYLLADLKHDDQELDDARRYYRQAAEASPAMNEAGLALMRLGGLALLEEDYGTAAEIFEEYRRIHPEGRRWAQSTYWAARAYRALGQAELADRRLRELRATDPVSYHGVLAAGILGEPVLEIAMGEPPAPDSAVDRAVRDGLRRVDLLGALGRRDDLVREVERLRRELEVQDAAAYTLAEALNERGHTLTAIGMGWDLYRRRGEWDQRLLRIIYPFPFQDLVLPESRERELDPYLVAGLIRRESAFNPTVRSGAGAIGLMQIMPETGRTLARATELRDFHPDLLTQPEVNVHLGTRYFATMLDRFDGDLPLVLSAYNAGPTRAVRWRDLPEARDPELFTERIPYSETRDYVRNVVLHRAIYRELYPDLGGG